MKEALIQYVNGGNELIAFLFWWGYIGLAFKGLVMIVKFIVFTVKDSLEDNL